MARKPNPLKDYDFVTREATSDEGMSTEWAMRFHCFNPNGAYEKLKASHERINAWVDAHPERPNGVLFVHGSLNDFPRSQLFAVLDLWKHGKAYKYPLYAALRLIDREIDRANEFIVDETKWPAAIR